MAWIWKYEVNIDETFAYNIAINVMSDNEDKKSMIIEGCWQRNDWLKWKDAIEA